MPEQRNKTIDDLRATLFATLDGLKAGTVTVDQARAINEVGKTLVDTAKVEIDYLRVTDGDKSEFLGSTIGAANLPAGITGVVRHRLAG